MSTARKYSTAGNSLHRENDDQAPDAKEIVEALMRTVHAFKRQGNLCFARQQHLQAENLEHHLHHEFSVARMRLLVAVAESPMVRMGDLSTSLGVTARTVTTMVDALEKDGLLARHPDPKDRRAIRLELTDDGLAQLEQIHTMQREISETFLAPLNAEQRRHLLDILNCLAAAGTPCELPNMVK